MFSESSREAKTAKSAKILSECTALGRPLGGESSEKVIKTIKIRVVWTVSNGGYSEK
jgi:hypothetical protein